MRHFRFYLKTGGSQSIYQVILFRSCPVQISYKLAEDDKVKMAEKACAQRLQGPPTSPPRKSSGGLPPLRYLPDDTDGWVTCEEPILYFYAGKGPFVSRYVGLSLSCSNLLIRRCHCRDYMAFPVSVPNDGLVDIMTMPAVRAEGFLESCLTWYFTVI